MGAWDAGIFDDDVAMDVQDLFEHTLSQGDNVAEATAFILEEYEELLEDDDDGVIIFLALASLQIKHKALQPEIKDRALEIIENGQGLEVWEESGEAVLEHRKKVFEELKRHLVEYI